MATKIRRKTSQKKIIRFKHKLRIKDRVAGSGERPRLVVFRSNAHLYVQVVDDTKSCTLISFSTQDKVFTQKFAKASKSEKAKALGAHFAAKMKEKGVTQIAFDRGGYQYHGRIKALAESLREAGILF
jgi:large subunit ribosomal protein L18